MGKYRLLEHPFYQAWNEGRITLDKLSEYGNSYLQIIEKMPIWWSKVLLQYNLHNTVLNNIVEEEKSHINLWIQWLDKLPKVANFPTMDDIIEKIESLESSELLGAIHSFELQQPEVARLKKEILINYYNFEAQDLKYFDEHIKEEEHINTALYLYEEYADKEKFSIGLGKGYQIFYTALDKFI